MVYELKDTTKAEALFEGMEDTLIRSCLQGVMGKIYVTDPERPRSALAYLGFHANYAGEPYRRICRRGGSRPGKNRGSREKTRFYIEECGEIW